MGHFDDWKMKTYKARKRFRMAGTSILFTPFFSTDDPSLQDRIERHPWFRTGVIFEVVKDKQAEETTAADEIRKINDPHADLESLSRRDLQSIAKRLEVNAGGTNADIISRICETSPDPASGTAR